MKRAGSHRALNHRPGGMSATMPLTDTKLRKIQPREKMFKLYDGSGLEIQITPAGGKRWRYNYTYNGKRKTLSMGTYPLVSLALAREKRDDCKRLLVDGIDPAEQRKQNRQKVEREEKNTFEFVAREWHASKSKSWAKSHSSRVLARLELDIFPMLGKRDIADIEAPELLEALRRIEARGANESARRVKTICGQVFRFGIATARCKQDVAALLHGALVEVKKGNFAATTDPAPVGELLRKVYGYTGTIQVTTALKMAPHVFVRAGELRQAKWADIDLASAEWRYRVSKTDTDHIVPLSTQVVGMLREIEPFTGHRPYVFPSARSGNRPMSDAALLAAMRTMGVAKEDHTTHGWRATARTLLEEELRYRPAVIEMQLAHQVKDSNGTAYNRTRFLDDRRHMMQAWSDYLDRLRNGADVVQLNKKTG